ncbi:MAG: hypothetical protein IJT82_09300 [Schwartzia sp.]|nr:hypothetical protein [Schwartzia sp. (in: firmicutes)]
METHEVQVVSREEQNIFNGQTVTYEAVYYHCENTDEYYADETMLAENDVAMKNAYRKAKGLLTTDEIIAVRKKYNISQNSLCIVLGWGEKTIHRYEGHQVQDYAHDSILRKINDDPEWFLALLEKARPSLSPNIYSKCRSAGEALYTSWNTDGFIENQPGKAQIMSLVCSHKGVKNNTPASFYYQGKEEERLSALRNLMDTMSISLRQAMEALKIPSSEYEKYAAVM